MQGCALHTSCIFQSMQWFFYPHTLSCDWTNHRAGSQLKKCQLSPWRIIPLPHNDIITQKKEINFSFTPVALLHLFPAHLKSAFTESLEPVHRTELNRSKKCFIAFLDTLSYDWALKMNLYFSSLKGGIDFVGASCKFRPSSTKIEKKIFVYFSVSGNLDHFIILISTGS